MAQFSLSRDFQLSAYAYDALNGISKKNNFTILSTERCEKWVRNFLWNMWVPETTTIWYFSSSCVEIFQKSSNFSIFEPINELVEISHFSQDSRVVDAFDPVACCRSIRDVN